jgi:hypothetical protein
VPILPKATLSKLQPNSPARSKALMHLPEDPDVLSASEPEQKTDLKKERDGDEHVMSASEPDGPTSLRAIAIKLRSAPDSPAPPTTYEAAIRSALRGWDIKGSGQSGWQCSRGNDRLVDEGERVRAKNGSPAEVEGLFAVARAKNWPSMAFSGSEAFKRNVMETALRSGCIVHAQSPADQKLLAEVTREHQRAQTGKTAANAQQPEVRQTGPNLPDGDGKSLPVPDKSKANAILEELQATRELERNASLSAPKQLPALARPRANSLH